MGGWSTYLAWGKAFRVFGSQDLPRETCNNCRLCSWLPHGTWPTPSTFFYLNMRINYIQRGSERSWMLRSLHTSFGHSHPHVSLHSRVSFSAGLSPEGLLHCHSRTPAPYRGGFLADGVGVEVPHHRYAHRSSGEGAGMHRTAAF